MAVQKLTHADCLGSFCVDLGVEWLMGTRATEIRFHGCHSPTARPVGEAGLRGYRLYHLKQRGCADVVDSYECESGL